MWNRGRAFAVQEQIFGLKKYPFFIIVQFHYERAYSNMLKILQRKKEIFQIKNSDIFSNILKILQPKKKNIQIKKSDFFFISAQT